MDHERHEISRKTRNWPLLSRVSRAFVVFVIQILLSKRDQPPSACKNLTDTRPGWVGCENHKPVLHSQATKNVA